MSSLVLLGPCAVCNTVKYVPAYSRPPQSPRCGCTYGLTMESGTAARTFDFDVAEAVEIFRTECREDDIRDTLLRMHSFLSVVGSSYAEGDGKGFISGLISLSALAKVLSETADEEEDEPEAGSVP